AQEETTSARRAAPAGRPLPPWRAPARRDARRPLVPSRSMACLRSDAGSAPVSRFLQRTFDAAPRRSAQPDRPESSVSLKAFVIALAVILAAAVVSGMLLVGWALGKLREKRLRVPPGADFFSTVRAVPLPLLVGLDLLDLGLDVFSAPIIWFILNRLKLQ